MEAEKATSLRRGLEILLALGADEALENRGLGVTRLAQLLGSDKSRVSRTLRTLEEYELVQRDPSTLAYRIGWRMYTLARREGDARLLDAAPARIERLVREFDEAVHLSVLTGARVLTVSSRAPDRALNAGGLVGRTVPAYCTSSGRALLFDHDRQGLEEVLGGTTLQAAGPDAPRDVDELFARIEAARRTGYAVAVEESEPGLVAVAAPVRDHRGFIVAALNLSAPAFRFQDRLTVAGERVRVVAEELSHVVGWSPQAAIRQVEPLEAPMPGA